MLTLPTAIQAAIGATTRRPAVRVTLIRDVPSYVLLATYAFPGGGFHNAACVAPDGSIVRAAMQNTAGSAAGQVWVQRVTSPGTASQWNAWATLGGADKLRDGGIALGTAGATVYLFCCDGASDNVLLATSADSGQTWSTFGSVIAVAPTETVRALCFAPGSNTSGDPSVLFAIVDDGSLSATVCTLRLSANAGAGFGTPFTTPAGTPSGPSSAGVAALRQSAGVFLVVPCLYALSQATGGGLALGSYVWNQGSGALTASTLVVPNDDASLGVQVKWPQLARDAQASYVLSYVEQDTGGWSGVAYSRAILSTSGDGVHWDEGLDFPAIPLNAQTASYEQPLLYTGGSGYLVDNTHVYQASTSPATLDVSALVLRYTYTRDAERAGVLQLDLDNAAGTLVLNAAFGLNSRIKLEEGYYDGAGVAWYVTTNDHLYLRRYAVQRATRGQTPVNELHLEADDSLCKLDREARHDWLYQNQTLAWLAAELVARGGGAPATIPGTSQFGQAVPAFRVGAGQRWDSALGRLLGIYGSWYRSAATGGVVVQELAPGDAPVWSYAPSDLEASRWGAVGDRDNHVRVYGKPPAGVATLPVGESWDFAHVAQTWERRYRHVVEQAVTTTAQAALRSGFELADRQRQASLHAIQVCHNPGLELYDVVTVSDPAAGVGGNYRVKGAVTTFDAAAADFGLRLQLEGV